MCFYFFNLPISKDLSAASSLKLKPGFQELRLLLKVIAIKSMIASSCHESSKFQTLISVFVQNDLILHEVTEPASIQLGLDARDQLSILVFDEDFVKGFHLLLEVEHGQEIDDRDVVDVVAAAGFELVARSVILLPIEWPRIGVVVDGAIDASIFLGS